MEDKTLPKVSLNRPPNALKGLTIKAYAKLEYEFTFLE